MKKTILLIAMATLCLFLRTNAQVPSNPKLQLRPLAIGQMMPELTLTGVHNYKSNTLNLADLEAKLIIIDFWATWCSPCVAMIPKIDQLQQRYHGDIQFISVTYQKEEEVVSFMKKLEERGHVTYQVPLITNDKTLNKLFPHTTLPHYVWIGANGLVKAITGMEDVTAENIDKMLDNQTLSLREKKETSIPYDSSKPFLIDRNGGDGKEMVYHSVLSGYVEGLPSKFLIERADSVHVNRLLDLNTSILWLYKYAFGKGYTTFFPANNVSIEVEHPEELTTGLSSMAYLDWLSRPGHGFCYELRLPKNLAFKFFEVMQANLKLLFPQYTATVEKRKVKTMVLVRLKGADVIQTSHPGGQRIEKFNGFGFKLQNSNINTLIDRVKYGFHINSKYPFRNETGYEGQIDMVIKADLRSITDMNRAFQPYNLQWKEREIEQNVLVIQDAKNYLTAN
jgi:thiol-disulfide isomerase/thioredoxin